LRQASDRAVLSRAKPGSLWRLARYMGVGRERCDCALCLARLVDKLARLMAVTDGGSEALALSARPAPPRPPWPAPRAP
jgi:hypothetical protein